MVHTLHLCGALMQQWTHKKLLQSPTKIFFGRQICRKSKDPPFWWRYRLPVRPVLGPTSLDCELAFLMCNQVSSFSEGALIYAPLQRPLLPSRRAKSKKRRRGKESLCA